MTKCASWLAGQSGHESIDGVDHAPRIHVQAPLPVLCEYSHGPRLTGTDAGIGEYQLMPPNVAWVLSARAFRLSGR